MVRTTDVKRLKDVRCYAEDCVPQQSYVQPARQVNKGKYEAFMPRPKIWKLKDEIAREEKQICANNYTVIQG